MIVTVPAYKRKDIEVAVKVELVVVSASKSSEAVEFSFEPGRPIVSTAPALPFRSPSGASCYF